MRIEAQRPYGLPQLPQDANEASKDKAPKAPESKVNAAGDEFQLSSKQVVTRSLVQDELIAPADGALNPERTADIRAKISSGYYLSKEAAEVTASAITGFHG
jgi:anti-sigma28 factor (negative regulator of flagellin synthesis)